MTVSITYTSDAWLPMTYSLEPSGLTAIEPACRAPPISVMPPATRSTLYTGTTLALKRATYA